MRKGATTFVVECGAACLFFLARHARVCLDIFLSLFDSIETRIDERAIVYVFVWGGLTEMLFTRNIVSVE